MELIRTIKKRHQIACERTINEEASNTIYLDDFDGDIYISYNGAPLIPIDEKWTQKEIMRKLEDTRNSYINYRKKQAKKPTTALL